MQHLKRPPFPCSSCGECCKNIGNSSVLSNFDRGDGICKFLDRISNLCVIYENRPIFCKIETYYETYLEQKISWEKFVQMNIKICIKLQNK